MKIVALFLLNLLIGSDGWSEGKQRSFPPQFLFGAASSAYQVEGAWNADGKGESIWDRLVHEHPELIADGHNGDVAADSYNLWQRDVEMLREIGADFYRFSISWSRVMPNGFPNSLNEAGLEYYDNLINELLKYGILPMVTLYHFDLPQYLQDLGGWSNPLSVDWFENYARVIFERFAARVKFWITINQPRSICKEGYESDSLAPALNLKGIGTYVCTKNVLLAHAKTYRLYQDLYKTKYQGNVGISMELNWYDPFKNSTEHKEATERARAFEIGTFVDPIFSKTGNFPQLVRDIVNKKSTEQGFSKSRLPKLSEEEIKLIKGSADFLGVNHYTTFLVKNRSKEQASPSFDDDVSTEYTQSPKWKGGKSSWLKSVPYGIYKICIHLNLAYDYPVMFVTEHGWSTGIGLGDQSRVDNMRDYLNALLLAMEDGTQLKGYTAWSLMDNVEWTSGTSEHFGLYEVNFDSPLKTRTARLSALVYKNIIETRNVDPQWKPESMKIKITKNRSNVKGEL